MKDTLQLLSLFLQYSLLLFHFSSPTHAKSVIEPCNSQDSCPSLLAYRLPWTSEFSEIASLFQSNLSDILASNNLDPTNHLSRNYQILASNSLVKVPIPCLCVDGIRRSLSTVYVARPADTVESISEEYGGLVSEEQIRSVNGVNVSNPLVIGQRLVIPLPCTCFENRNNGATAVYMSYVVRKGENLSRIAAEYGTTVTDLLTVNGLAQPLLHRRDILAVPLPACSSANLNWRNESLIVPNGSYVLTANNCIKCSCAPTDLSLQCSPSRIETFCSSLQCKGSNLFIGEANEKLTELGCNVTACVYRGHSGTKIFSSLLNYSHIQCRGNKSHATVSPFTSPSNGIITPLLIFPPSSSPSPSTSPSSSRPKVIVPSNPAKKHTSNSRDGRLLSQASCVGLLLLEFALSFIL